MAADKNFRLRVVGQTTGLVLAVQIERFDGMWYDKTNPAGALNPNANTPIQLVANQGAMPLRYALTMSTLPVAPATTSFWLDGSYFVYVYVWNTATNALGGQIPEMSMTFNLIGGSDQSSAPTVLVYSSVPPALLP